MTQYAILVGIGKYEDPQISDPEFAENDVKSFRECLITQVNFPEENVHVFTSARGYNYAAHILTQLQQDEKKEPNPMRL